MKKKGGETLNLSFFSNYMNHHQHFLADAFNKELKENYTFIATSTFNQARASLGYKDENKSAPFILRAYENETAHNLAIQHACEDDYMIIGSAPDYYADIRLKHGKTVFRYSERYFKSGLNIKTFFRYYFSAMKHIRKYQNKPLYYLCSSAFTAADINMFADFSERTYKWGYFTEVKQHNIDELMQRKSENEKVTILWAGRLIGWKHPDAAIVVARKLKEDGISFQMEIVGNGEMEGVLRSYIYENGLEDSIFLLGSMSPEKVREKMEQANIFLFTSDFNEGWGAVLNESMNSGCAVVASHAIGSVPFLIENEVNGLIYKNADNNDLYQKVKKLVLEGALRERLGRKAYATMYELWNPQVAAKRFLLLAQEIEKNGQCDLFENGPCSRAKVLKNDWM